MRLSLTTNAAHRRLRQAFQQAPQITGRVMERAVFRAASVSAASVRSQAPPSFGPHITPVLREIPDGWQGAVVVDTRAKPHAPFVERGTRPHLILPRRGTRLRFEIGGATIFARAVRHPGSRGRWFLREGMRAARPQVRAILAEGLRQIHRQMLRG